MKSRYTFWIRLALAGHCLAFGSAAAWGLPLAATLTTDRGCGGSATYLNGETIHVRYSVSDDATVSITLTRPDGFVLHPIIQQSVPAGATQEYTAIVDGVSGPRQLWLDATSAAGAASAECIYYGVSEPPLPPPPLPPLPAPLTAELDTNRGCGAAAVFAPGEQILFRYRVSQSALVTLRLQRPDGTLSTLLSNQPVPGGITQTLAGVIRPPAGQRLLLLDAVSSTETAHQQCTYSAQGTTAGPETLTVSADRGCGNSYQEGETVTILYRSPVTTTVTLQLQLPDGSIHTMLQNQHVLSGQTYSTVGIVGNPTGTRRLILSAAGGVASLQPATCSYRVAPP